MKFKADKNSLSYQLRQAIYQAAVSVMGKSVVKLKDVVLEHPAQPEHGDYSCNLAMRAFDKKFLTPFDLANEIVNAWRSSGLPEKIAKIEVARSGFINIWLKNEALISELNQVLAKKDSYGSALTLADKEILLEHTSPNPQTTIMLGHLRNNFLGMSTAEILRFLGAKVTLDCVNNDRGIHLCRSIWGYLVFGQKRRGLKKDQLLNFRKLTEKQLDQVIKGVDWHFQLKAWQKKKSNWWQPKDLGLKPDHANLIWYVLGSKAYKNSSDVEIQVKKILKAWEAGDKAILQVWQQLLGWSFKGYQQTYSRIASRHDWVWQESEHYQQGKAIVELGLKKGVFQKSEGAIVTKLAQFGLPDTVVVKTDGTSLYLTQDLALTKLKTKKFPSDLYIWCVAEEQNLYFKQLFVICEQLGIAVAKKLFHLNYSLINFKDKGKMATRSGNVIKADDVLDDLKTRAAALVKEKMTKSQLEKLTETVAVGSAKYSLLKFGRQTTIHFDPEESISLEGNSAPYLLYTYARCQSVLQRSQHLGGVLRTPSEESLPPPPAPEAAEWLPRELKGELSEEEVSLLRWLDRFPEVVFESGKSYNPNLICNFLFDLAQKYNLFYQKQPILKAEPENLKDFRLALTQAAAQIIKNGLGLLGIETVQRM